MIKLDVYMQMWWCNIKSNIAEKAMVHLPSNGSETSAIKI